LWDVESGNSLRVIDLYGADDRRLAWGNTLAYAPNERLLICGASNGVIHFWQDLNRNANEVEAIRLQNREVESIALSNNSDFLAVLESNELQKKSFSLWSLRTRHLIKRQEMPLASSLTMSPDGKQVAIGYEDGHLDLLTIPQLRTTRQWTIDDLNVSAVAFSPDEKWLAAGSLNGTLVVCALRDTCDDMLVVHEGSEGLMAVQNLPAITSIDFQTGSGLLASAERNGALVLWSPDSRKIISREVVHGSANAVRFSPDGRLLASGHSDGGVRIWTVASANIK
jgi:WD40 repeat protein